MKKNKKFQKEPDGCRRLYRNLWNSYIEIKEADKMAESMQGLHRTCRCAEVTTQMVGSDSNPYGLGSEELEIKEESFS